MKRMRDVFPAAFVALALMLCASTPLESADTKIYADHQVIVKLRRGLLKTDGDKIRGELRSKTKHRFKLIDVELWDISGMTVDEAIKKYRGDPRIEYIEPNYILRADEVIPNDPSFPLLWGLHNTGQSGGTPDADIDAPEAWSFQTGAQVVIGVIDTGVDRTHPDLAANMWTNPGEIAGNGLDDDGNGYVDDVHGWDFVNGDNDPMDDHGHGTHCAGTIAGIGDNGIGVAGVCWHARVMALKFLDAGGYGTTSAAVLAVEYATANGARLTSNSWGGGSYSQALYDAIAAARDAGVLFIAAAGNDAVNNDLYPHYPSSYDLDNIIAVAATDRYDDLADFSCYGAASVDVGAPGEPPQEHVPVLDVEKAEFLEPEAYGPETPVHVLDVADRGRGPEPLGDGRRPWPDPRIDRLRGHELGPHRRFPAHDQLFPGLVEGRVRRNGVVEIVVPGRLA